MTSKKARWRSGLVAGVFVAALVSSAADAATVAFTIKNGPDFVALGSFDYSSANPILSYSDLDSFSLTIGAITYDLSFVSDPSRSVNSYFQYDTAAAQFIDAPVPAMYGIDTELASMPDNYGDGFIFTFGNDQYYTYDGGATPDDVHQPWTDLQLVPSTQSTAPEPGTLAVFGAGLAGFALRRRYGRIRRPVP